MDRASHDRRQVRKIAEDWFGFKADTGQSRGSFRGATTKDIYTKAAHFALLREMLPPGHVTITTEQEATFATLLPHIFEQEIRRGAFTWLMMSFNKEATKPEILQKVRESKKRRWEFYNAAMYDGFLTPDSEASEVTRAFIAKAMSVATGPKGQSLSISNYQGAAFPRLWVRSPAQPSGELDKVVAFPLVPRGLRQTL
ncbi:hypothetical protein [Rhodobacter sp. CZR27]|uniref:hypothetical protein n=1 Tax=Rhodobacter sp. CZR27 TaxID=2033869 RepID=UPI000BBE9CF8|nr:hypothetical protein [Rhodobacter sp. CZR27]